jgi:threonine aldolase
MQDTTLIDLCSNTVTRPCAGMREAKARVDDDVRGEDPTVNELERYLADLTGVLVRKDGKCVAQGA